MKRGQKEAEEAVRGCKFVKWDAVPAKVDKTYDDVELTYFHSDRAILRIRVFNDKTNRNLEPAGFSRIHNRTFSCLSKRFEIIIHLIV